MEISDIQRVAEIQVFCWRTSELGITPNEHLFKNMTVSKRAEFFETTLLNNTDETYVYDDGIIKAFIMISPGENRDTHNSMHISSVYVEPSFQQNGIGSQLMDYAENIATQKGCMEISLWVLEKNHRARTFYEALKYEHDGNKNTGGLGTTEVRYRKPM